MSNPKLQLERLETRLALDSTGFGSPWHNAAQPTDVNGDQEVGPLDALLVINALTPQNTSPLAELATPPTDMVDVDADGVVSPADALAVINNFPSSSISQPRVTQIEAQEYFATFDRATTLGPDNLLTEADVESLLNRATRASASNDAIIAIVDRVGRILGVRVENGVSSELTDDPDKIAFAIDGAVAKARTAAFFSSGQAPLTSRTVRFISQSTVTQREVESSPLNTNARYTGPGFVAPIGVGGHFPPEVAFTPQVDLFAIEHQSRDSQFNFGFDAFRETDYEFELVTRFNVDPAHIAPIDPMTPAAFDPADFFAVWPEAYGTVAQTPLPNSGVEPNRDAQSRGIATLPGGVPLYKTFEDPATPCEKFASDGSSDVGACPFSLVGGIGVFFPGVDGFATHEQGFEHVSERTPDEGVQSEFDRTNAPRVLESEFIATITAAAGGLRARREFQFELVDVPLEEGESQRLGRFVLPVGRIDLVGITLEIFGPTPTRQSRIPGFERLMQEGRSVGQLSSLDASTFTDYPVDDAGELYLDGQPVPERWLVQPHSAADGSLTAEDVKEIISNGIAEANLTRAAIRLTDNLLPGTETRMVFAVTDTLGNVLGLYRMEDATIFSIDVAVAKARNTAYYADATQLLDVDRIDFNGDGTIDEGTQDTVPRGTALTNRTFRFLVEPRYPTGAELQETDDDGLVNDGTNLCNRRPDSCTKVGSQSILRLPGINPLTAENLDDSQPLDVSFYNGLDSGSFLAFDAFVPSRNFRDPGDSDVMISGTGTYQPLANQNGIVFFPGSAPLYGQGTLVGGFGVSGDGVDQDDVVTSVGIVGFEALDEIRVDQFLVGDVRLPYLKFNRNPRLP